MKTIKTVTSEYDAEGRLTKQVETTETIQDHTPYYTNTKCADWRCRLCYPHYHHGWYPNVYGQHTGLTSGTITSGMKYYGAATTGNMTISNSPTVSWTGNITPTANPTDEDKDEPGDGVAA